jgi:hypothetical protein
MRSSACATLVRLGVRGVLCWSAFDQQRDCVRRLAPRLRQHGDERPHAVLAPGGELLLDVGGDQRRPVEGETDDGVAGSWGRGWTQG